MPAPHLETLELDPDQTANASVIWMHGLGADASDFYSVVPELRLPPELAVRFVFPNAPRIPVTINMGMIMQASGSPPSGSTSWWHVRSIVALPLVGSLWPGSPRVERWRCTRGCAIGNHWRG